MKQAQSPVMKVIDNFLAEEEFIAIRDMITHKDFLWNFSPVVTLPGEGPSPGLFSHVVYHDNVPRSQFYESHFLSVLTRLNAAVIFKIKINLHPRLSEPYHSLFHIDSNFFSEDIASQWTTSILYINTNNGYTEMENGQKIESVKNRLLSYPLNTQHRIVTQTDTQTRLLINFNYLKYNDETTTE